MLILKRCVGERIWIGQDVTVKIMSVCGDIVKLGVDAPRAVEVDREEVRALKRAQVRRE